MLASIDPKEPWLWRLLCCTWGQCGSDSHNCSAHRCTPKVVCWLDTWPSSGVFSLQTAVSGLLCTICESRWVFRLQLFPRCSCRWRALQFSILGLLWAVNIFQTKHTIYVQNLQLYIVHNNNIYNNIYLYQLFALSPANLVQWIRDCCPAPMPITCDY